MKRASDFLLLPVLIGLGASFPGALAAEPSDPVAALKAALAKRAEHSARWLDERDYKSLAQSTGGITLLAEVLKSKGDDSTWQLALDDVLTKARELQAVARDEDEAKSKAALANIEQSIGRLERIKPAGAQQELPKVPIRPLMLTYDSIQADAKVAVLTGNVAGAKNQAAVLAELSRLVSNSRTGETWSHLAADFQKACQTAANTQETDPKTVRQLFRGIAQRCEACHENSRQR
jgi:hypothetical protein